MSDQNIIEDLRTYYERVGDFAKASEPLLPHAAQLSRLPEWDAFKQILMTKIAKKSMDVIFGGPGVITERERGVIEGMVFVIELAEKHLPVAMDKKKESLLRKSQKDNHLTGKQD